MRALLGLLSLLIASSASAVTMAWTPVGNPGNACDPQSQGCFGAVGYAYSIGTYEVTNTEYTEFLNAKAASDPLGLYNVKMGSLSTSGGITRTGSAGSYTYSTIGVLVAQMPVNYVSVYDMLRFANWMNNGQGNADTETGAYTLLGGTPNPSNGPTVTRNASATIVLASENEWYKAAYYSPSGTYFDYPSGSDSPIVCSPPTAQANRASCGLATSGFTIKGIYSGSASPYGTFDQGGNAWEVTDTITSTGFPPTRAVRGGAFDAPSTDIDASSRTSFGALNEFPDYGFRLAMIPEPSTCLLVVAGLIGFGGWRRASA